MTKRLAMATLGLVAAVTTMGAGQGSGLEPLLAELRNPSARARANALERLGELGRPDAAAPIAAMLADGNDGVQSAAINALLSLYTVRADLRQRQWGPGSVGKSATPSEVAFEAGPLATMPAAVPAQVLTGLSGRRAAGPVGEDAAGSRLCAGHAGSPAMGPMDEATANAVAADLAATLLDPDRPTRQVVARVAGRVFTPTPGRTVPASHRRRLDQLDERRRPAGAPLGHGLAGLAPIRPRGAGADRSRQLLRQERGRLGGAARAGAHCLAGQRARVSRAAGQRRADLPRHLHRGARPDRRPVGVPRHRRVGDRRQAGQRHAGRAPGGVPAGADDRPDAAGRRGCATRTR